MSDALTIAESSQKHYRAVGLALAASILWSSGGLFIKWVTWNPLAISGARSAIAIVVLLIALRRVQFSWSFAQVGGAVAHTVTVTLFVVATSSRLRPTPFCCNILRRSTQPCSARGSWASASPGSTGR